MENKKYIVELTESMLDILSESYSISMVLLYGIKIYIIKKPSKPIKPTWIQFRDKVVDLITGEEFEATPEYFVTNPIPYNLHKDNLEATPIMDKIFEEWVGKDYVKTLYEILAYTMIPDYPINRLFCFIGSGMNGKSCFLNLLKIQLPILNDY
jgi:phage/plasmid-associated DNA primase